MTRRGQLDPRFNLTHHPPHETIEFACADRSRRHACDAAVRLGAGG